MGFFRHLFDKRKVQSEPDSSSDNKKSHHDTGASVLFDGTSGEKEGGVDIIFVHGLRGSPIRTWSEGNVCWPRDLLKEDIPNARVITWGYDSGVARPFRYTSLESVYGHAETLLGDISSLRQDTTRPIVFVAHSLGGLVVKDALITASSYHSNSRHTSLGRVFPDTKGILFFGTPHRGSSKESLGEIVASISKLCLHKPNQQLLRTLREDSHILERQRNEFTTISQGISVICVREELPTAIGMLTPEKIVPRESATYDGYNVRRSSIHSDHMGMVRFENREDSRYQRAIGLLAELAATGSQSNKEANSKGGHTDSAILDALFFEGLTTREDNIEDAHDETFQWLLSNTPTDGDEKKPTFVTWINSQQNLLWVSGKAASGKSTLMKFIDRSQSGTINECLASQGVEPIIVRFFFFDRGSDLQKSREGVLRSILFQILSADRSLLEGATRSPKSLMVDRSGGVANVPGYGTLNWDTLRHMFDRVIQAAEERGRAIFLLLDGLDEYRVMDRLQEYSEEDFDLMYDGEDNDAAWGTSAWITAGHREIGLWIKKFRGLNSIKVCFSSRELSVFETLFQGVPRIQVHEHTANDISRVCRDRLATEAPGLTDSDSIVDEITSNARGVFLWEKLVLDRIIEGYINGDTSEELKSTLRSLPKRLGGPNGLYMTMLRRVSKDYQEESSVLFDLVLGVDRVLHIAELFMASDRYMSAAQAREDLPVHQWKSLGDFEAYCKSKSRRLKSRCGGLLEADYAVTFMHQTAKEFISRDYIWRAVFGQARGNDSLATHSALVRGSTHLVKSLSSIELPADFPEGWNTTHRPVVQIRSIMNTLTLVDRGTEDPCVYADLVDNFKRACDLLPSAIRTCFTDLVFDGSDVPKADSLWFDLVLPRDIVPRCKDFNSFAAQYGLSRYLDHKLSAMSNHQRGEETQRLLELSFMVHRAPGADGFIMNVDMPVATMLFSQGASLNPSCRLPWAAAIGLTRQASAWVDLIEAGYGRFVHETDLVPRLHSVGAVSEIGLLWREGYPNWLHLVLLMLSHGAQVDIMASVTFEADISSTSESGGTVELVQVTVASIIESIIELRSWDQADAVNLVKEIHKHTRRNGKPELIRFHKSKDKRQSFQGSDDSGSGS
ncbi:uncharacterized protein E0L32_001122 [Thyridium curvatum]|uniref:NACHT domain-containing protein n=1 Tax=Thyridium curvatum TaxID=1093900 RepID=A0A507AXY4_9PEZI|nr:uncharacterized protein E0L32_001122 [Thyridium curvatum]TPX11304.1 hypothetical protein E0L32_001122 [Thyridium curvatum]